MHNFLSFAFIGIYTTFCLLFLLLFYTYKKNEYLFFFLYLTTITVYYSLFNTYWVFPIGQIDNAFTNMCKEIVSSLAILCYALFSYSLLDIKKQDKNLRNSFLFFIGLNVVALVLYPTLYLLKLPNQQLYYFLTLFFAPVAIYNLIKAFYLKIPYSKFILIGTSITTLGGICSIILSVLKSNNSYWPGQFAMVIDIVLFIYATQKKIIDVAKENLQLKYKAAQTVYEERQRMSMELHDDVGGGLSTIRLLTEMMLTKENDNKNLQIISKHSKELVLKLNEIVWSLNNKNDDLNGLIAYIRQYVVSALEEVNIKTNATIIQPIPLLIINGKNRRTIFLIVKEIINNCIKHSKANTVTMLINFNNKNLEIKITDNGIGFEHNNIKPNSYGIQNLIKKVEAFGGLITFESNNGVTVHVTLPLKIISYKSAIE